VAFIQISKKFMGGEEQQTTSKGDHTPHHCHHSNTILTQTHTRIHTRVRQEWYKDNRFYIYILFIIYYSRMTTIKYKALALERIF